MKIKAIAPWFGGKRTLAPRIVAELGRHSAYWEPFCGSMAVLLAKPACPMETVNDLHGELVNLGRVIQHGEYGPKLYRRLRRAWCSEPHHRECAEWVRERANAAAGEPDVDRAYDYFVAAWLGRNGLAGTSLYDQGFCRRFTKNGGNAAKRFASSVDSIPSWRRRMRCVTILADNGFDLLPRIEDANAVAMYIDPPYVTKGAKYVHDFDAGDHALLAGLLARFRKTRVVLSYYDDPLVRELYCGAAWTFVECPITKAMVNQSMRDKKGATTAPELLIVNGPSYTQSGELF